MFHAQNRETINSTWKVAASFKVIMTTKKHARPCFTTQHQTCKTKTTACKTKTKTDFFWSQTGLVLRPMVSDHITGPKLYTYREWSNCRPDHSNFRSTVELNERRQYFVASLYVSFFVRSYIRNKRFWTFDLSMTCRSWVRVNQSLIMWSLGYVKLLKSFTFVQSKIHMPAYFRTVAEPTTRFCRNGKIHGARFWYGSSPKANNHVEISPKPW